MSDRYPELFGNEGIKETLVGFTRARAFPHALILHGPEGSGKTLLSKLIAMSIACQSEGERPCHACEACRKIHEGISPDVITVTTVKDRRTIGVEAVREIRETAYVVPNDLTVKIYCIKDAEKMTTQAQNALLKLFEEPPNAVFFLLMTSAASALLPTVRSRAPELRTELFSDTAMTTLLSENSGKARALLSSDPPLFRRILHAASGSYGRALSLIEGKSKKSVQGFVNTEKLLTALADSNKSEFLLLLLAETADRESYGTSLRLLQLALRDMIAARREGVELTFFADEPSALAAASRFTLPSLLNLSSALELLAIEATETNVNLRTAAVLAANRLWELK